MADDPDIELLDSGTAGHGRPEPQIIESPPSHLPLWLLGLAVLGAIFWVLGRSTGTFQAEGNETDEPASSMPTTRPFSSTVPQPADPDAVRRAEIADAMQAEAERSLTGTTNPGPRSGRVGSGSEADDYLIVDGIEEGAPPLGRPVGADLVMVAEGRLADLDLDTGRVTFHDRTTRSILGVDEGRLILQQADGTVAIVPVDDVDAPAIEVSELTDDPLPEEALAPSVVPGHVWVGSFGPVDGRVTYHLLDLDTGTVSRHETLPAGILATSTGPEIVSSPSGGVFELRETGYERIAAGVVVVRVGDSVLVRDCSDPLTCESRWFDAVSWDEDHNLATPPETAGVFVGSDFGDVVSLFGAGPPRFWDVTHGGFLDAGLGFTPFEGRVNAGGDVLVWTDGRRLSLLDRATGHVVTATFPRFFVQYVRVVPR